MNPHDAYRFAQAAALEVNGLLDLATRLDAPSVVWRHLSAARNAVADLANSSDLVAAGTSARAHMAVARFALDLVLYGVRDVMADAHLTALSDAALDGAMCGGFRGVNVGADATPELASP